MRLPGFQRTDPLAAVTEALVDAVLAQQGLANAAADARPQEVADELHKLADRVRAEAKKRESKPPPAARPSRPSADEAPADQEPAPTGGSRRGRRAREPKPEA